MKSILLFSLLVLPAFLFGQVVTGKVLDEQSKPLQSASIELLRAKDSSVAKLAVANEQGKFILGPVKAGKYFVRISNVGYKRSGSDPVDISEGSTIELPAFNLQKETRALNDVTVTGRRPMLEMKADKLIFNVEGSINATGSDLIELLQKSPGVQVDRDDNLSMGGKNGVLLYIDGKPSPLTGADLASYLRSIQSNQVEAIEIITNPSSKYDAAGNAGIINIKLKKDKNVGTNGSANAGYAIGVYGKFNSGLSINHRNKKVNLFGTYSNFIGQNEIKLNLERSLLDSFFVVRSVTRANSKSHNVKAGADYFLNSKSTIGILVNANFNNRKEYANSRTEIGYDVTKLTDRLLVARNVRTRERTNLTMNLNYKFSGKGGKELTIDADGGTFNADNDQLQPNYYFSPITGIETSRYIYNMITPTDITLFALKSDYEQDWLKGKLGMGFKSSYVRCDNGFNRYNVFSSQRILDSLRSNTFKYNENINAVYVNYNRSFKKIVLQLGLRVENTNVQGESEGYTFTDKYKPYDSVFTRHFTNLFPNAAITYTQNDNSQFTISYSRRIDRAAYEDLNPFENKLDEYSYFKGNTQLRPQFTHSFDLRWLWKQKLSAKLNYSRVSDVFTRIVDTVERTKSFLTPKNLATQDIVSLDLSLPVQGKWYNAFFNVNSYYTHYRANFGSGRIIDLDIYAVNMRGQQAFTLPHGFKIENSVNYSSPSIWSGTFRQHSIWGVDAGIQKELFQKKATLRVLVTDIFATMRWEGTSDFTGQKLHSAYLWEGRQFKVNLSYRFGKNTVKAARQRRTATEEEMQRTNGGG